MNLMEMTGRNVMVTGAAQGIGQQAAKLFYALGANLTLLDANAERLAESVTAFDPQRVLWKSGSVLNRDFVGSLVEESSRHFGGVHGLLNNAGITRTAMIDKMTLEQWQQVIDVNLTGVFNCLQLVGAEMKRRAESGEENAGSIVNVSSDAGRKGTIGQINYGAAKAGVLGITMSAAREWGRYGIRVNSVAYGVVETEMTETVRSHKFRDKYLAAIPLGRFVPPDAAVRSAAFLLSPAGDFITGQHLSVNGGAHMSA